MRERGRLLVVGALTAGALLVAQHPTADIRVLTHDAGDPAPRRVQAAVDLGLMGVSVLVTWSVKRLAR
jgi:hypothetical protein